MEITAIFDDVDTAEHALVGLRALGVNPLGYKIKRVRPMRGRSDTDMSDPPPPMGLTNSLAAGTSGAPAAMNAWTMSTALERTGVSLTSDGYSREVRLTVTVEDRAGIQAHRALVSNHGRRVQYQ